MWFAFISYMVAIIWGIILTIMNFIQALLYVNALIQNLIYASFTHVELHHNDHTLLASEKTCMRTATD